jgi:hypothetical protein
MRPRARNNVEKFNFPQMYLCSAQCPQDENTLLIRVAKGGPVRPGHCHQTRGPGARSDQPVASISTMETNIATSLAARR